MNDTTTHIRSPSPPSADLPPIGIVPYGLPSVALLAGGLFLALSLAGPFLVLVTIVLATAIFIAFTAGVLAAPYRLIRGIHRYRERRPSRRPLAHPVAQRQSISHGVSRRRIAAPVNSAAAQLPAAAHLDTAADPHAPALRNPE